MKGVFSTSRRHFVTACQVTGRTVTLALHPPGDCQAANEKKEKNPSWHLWQPPCALARAGNSNCFEKSEHVGVETLDGYMWGGYYNENFNLMGGP